MLAKPRDRKGRIISGFGKGPLCVSPGCSRNAERRNSGLYRSTCRKHRRPEDRMRPGRIRESPRWANDLQKSYGMSYEVWVAFLVMQAGRCAVCAEPMMPAYVDHN